MYKHGMHVLDGLLCELNYENMNVLQVLNDVCYFTLEGSRGNYTLL